MRTPHLLLAFILLDEASAPHRGLKELDSRIGVTITRKIDKRAVVRNRLRRRIKETFRLERGNFVAPVEMVVVALNGANELEFKDLRGEFLSLLRKAKILPNKQW